jgi:hypothetical protein
MSLKTGIFAIAVMFSASAFGADSQVAEGSQFQHQTAASTFELTPQLEYDSITLKLKSTTLDKAEIVGPISSVMGEYGLNDMFSVGLLLAYQSFDQKYSPSGLVQDVHQKGLKDPDLFLNGRVAAGPGSFRFGTHLSFSLEDSKTDSSGDSNAATGGTALTPFVGYEAYFGPHTVGARMTYTVYKGDRKQSDSSSGTQVNSTISGGETLTTQVFYEYLMEQVTLGVAAELNNIKGAKITSNGTSQDSSGSSGYSLAVYAPWQLAPNVTLLPRFNYGAFTAFDRTNIDSISAWGIQIGARFAF